MPKTTFSWINFLVRSLLVWFLKTHPRMLNVLGVQTWAWQIHVTVIWHWDCLSLSVSVLWALKVMNSSCRRRPHRTILFVCACSPLSVCVCVWVDTRDCGCLLPNTVRVKIWESNAVNAVTAYMSAGGMETQEGWKYCTHVSGHNYNT